MLDYRNLDWKLIGAVVLLTLIGIMMILSAQHYENSEYLRTYYQRQLIWMFISFILFAVILHLPIRMMDFTAYVFYGVSILLLVLVLFVGSSHTGATRWFSFGPINLAPSDVAKIAIVLALSRFFAYSKRPPASIRRLSISGLMVLFPVALIIKQPDLGTSLVFFVILFGLWFWSGLSPVWMLMILSPLISLVAASHPIIWAVYMVLLIVGLLILKPGTLFGISTAVANIGFGMITPFLWNRLADYQKLRIISFIDPGQDPRGAGYQIIQSKIAIGSGGILGKGYLNGSQTRLDFLPERHTDFIFSVVGEELGLWGTALVILLFGFIFYRTIRIAARCRSRFVSNMVIGAGSILFFQFVVNVGMTLGIMPVTGLALPFVSYGGTPLALCWCLIGLIVLADYHWQEY
jgi:rod shape determining protein RodA